MDNLIFEPGRLFSGSQLMVKPEIDSEHISSMMKIKKSKCRHREKHQREREEADRHRPNHCLRRQLTKRSRNGIEFQHNKTVRSENISTTKIEKTVSTSVVTSDKKAEEEVVEECLASQENKYAINKMDNGLLIGQIPDLDHYKQTNGCEQIIATKFKPIKPTIETIHEHYPASLPPQPPLVVQHKTPPPSPLCRARLRRKQFNSKQCPLIKALIILQFLQQTATTFYKYEGLHSKLLSSHRFQDVFVNAHHQKSVDWSQQQQQQQQQQSRKRTIDTYERVDKLLNEQILVDRKPTTPIDLIKREHLSSRDRRDEHIESNNNRQQHKLHNHKRRHHNYKGNNNVNHNPKHHHHAGKKNERTKRHDEQGGNYRDADRPVVSTKKGLIRGITQKIVNGKFVDAFLGIPFGQPPTGRYRFRHPQPVNPWQGQFDASKLSRSCFQVNDTFFGANFMGTSVWNANTPLDEDCLQLNIWTPFGIANTVMLPPEAPNVANNGSTSDYRQQQQPTSASKSSKRAVLVWIFGGGFYSGTSSLALYEGGALASEEDIIVVSINYRVSALGFLYFGRPDAPGNAGLFDQLLALQWINDNIDQFGGDPERITIFGESAGAVSVAFHLLSPLSRNLFSQAILQSGAATCPWGSLDTTEVIANGLQLASALNCPSNKNDLDSVMNCLLKADPMGLVSQEIGQTRSVVYFPFVPVVDGSFLLESPAESLAKANFKQARILLGSNNDEGNAFVIYLPEFSSCPATSTAGNIDDQQEQPTPNSQQQQSTAATNDLDSTKYSSSEPSDSQQTSTVMMNSLRTEDDTMIGEQTNGEHSDNIELSKRDGDTYNHHQRHHQVNNLPGQQQQPSSMIHRTSASSVTQSNKQEQQNLLKHQLQDLNDPKPCKPLEYLSLSREDFYHVLRDELNPYAENPIGKEAIVFEYTNWNNPQDPMSIYDSIDKIVGDYYFTCHVNEFAHRYAVAGNPVYMYHFKQRSSRSHWPKWMGVLHGDEINFVFGEPLNRHFNYTVKEVELSKRMMRYWGNFAKFGDPTKTGENTTMHDWPEYSDKREYFELHGDHRRIGRGPRAKQCAFWANYLPKLIQTLDKGQCQTNVTEPLLSTTTPIIHSFPTSSQQIGLPSLRNAFQQQLLSANPKNLFIHSIPSALLFGLILILIIALSFGIYFIIAKRSSSSNWKLSLWPLGGLSSTNGGTTSGGGGGESGTQATNHGGPSESSG